MDYTAQMRHYYEAQAPEEMRLQKNSVQHIEFLTATRYLDKCLSPKSRVLDSCAGTGVYSFYLAQKGHEVSAGDIVPRNVDIMRQRQKEEPILKEVYEGDALNLSRFEAESFDAVLCMGALYHLQEESERRRVVSESLRLLAPGGLFVASSMSRHAVIMNNLQKDVGNIEDMLNFAKSGTEGCFYADVASEVETLMRQCGLQKRYHVALDGMTYFLMHTAEMIEPAAFERWCRYHFAVCEEESLLGSSYHSLYIGVK